MTCSFYRRHPSKPSKTSTLQIEVAVGRSRDTDGDGVKDDSDVCAETPENTTVGKMGCPVGGIYFDKNEVTLKVENEATIGESYEFNGAIYKVVDENILRKMIAQGTDLTKVITTHVTNMSRLFHNQPHFNQDISTWDVSEVKDMSYMFGELAKSTSSFNQDLSAWDMSRVKTLAGIFFNAKAFN